MALAPRLTLDREQSLLQWIEVWLNSDPVSLVLALKP